MSDAEQTGPEAPAWPVVVDEAFAKSPDGWSFAATTKTPPLRFDAPGMVVTLPGGDTTVAAFWYEARQFTDVAVTVTLVVLAAQEPTQSYCGVSFRARSDKDNYRLFIDGDGFYRLTKRVDNVSTALVDWTRHEAIKAGIGEANVVSVVARGNRITVLANGQQLTSLEDDTFAGGHIALQAQGGSPETESATVFAFRNLEIAAPDTTP